MSNWGQRDDPSQLSSGERADHVAAELQAAFGGPASDVQRVCSLLCLLRQQFSEQAPRNWPADTVKRLWQSIIGALRVAQAPEVQVAACGAVEALGQSCSSCTDLERELSAVDDAVTCVVETLETASSQQVKAAAIKALLSLSGCLNCRCYYDKATQEVLGERGAVQALLAALPGCLAEAADAQQQQQAAAAAAGAAAASERVPDEGSQTVADIFRALHYTCLLNSANTARLVADGGYPLVVQGLAAMGKDLNVQEHGAMLLAGMACTPGVPAHDLLDGIITVANIARLQLQDKYIEVARAAVWSLGRLASHALSPPAAGVSEADSEREAARARAWPLLSDPVLRVVVSMLQSCHLQDDPLVKHCLDYIAVVASAAALHHTSPEGDDNRSSSGGSGLELPDRNGGAGAGALGEPLLATDESLTAGSGGAALLSLMRLAAEAVLATARVACDIRLQAVVLRTLHVLLLRFPGLAALQLSARQAEVLDQVVRIGAAARMTLEQQQTQQLQQQHHHQQQQQAAQQQAQQHIYASKDLFLVNLYSLTVAGAMTDLSSAAAAAAVAAANGGAVGAYQMHVLACLAGVVRHLSEGGGGDSVSFDDTVAAPVAAGDAAAAGGASYLSVGCCRYACHCCFIHDVVSGADVLAAGRAAAQLLVWCGGADGVNASDREGCGALHFLAAGGVAPLLAAFIDVAGPGLDFLRRTRAGVNALQLARVRKHAAAVQILEMATESAAKAAQDALLKELEEEGAQEGFQGAASKRAGNTAPPAAAGAARQHKAISGGGGHESNPPHLPSHGSGHGSGAALPGSQPPVESDEARRAREELERKRRAAEEAYEAALERRRRQLEEEARQQAAEEVRLIELAQAESLRMATPPPQPPPPVEASPAASGDVEPRSSDAAGLLSVACTSEHDAAAAAAAARGHFHEQLQEQQRHQHHQQEQALYAAQEQELQQLHAQQRQQQQQLLEASSSSPPPMMSAGGVVADSAASLHAAAAAAMAAGAPLPSSMTHMLTQLGAEQQTPTQQLLVQSDDSAGTAAAHRSPLSAMDEQITMLHGSAGPGTAMGMRRVVSKGSFLSDESSGGMQPGGGLLGGGGGLGGQGSLGGLSLTYSAGGSSSTAAAAGSGYGGYAGSFSNLLTAAAPMGLSGSSMEAPGLRTGSSSLLAGGGGGTGPSDGSHSTGGLRSMTTPGMGGGFGGADPRVGGGDGSVCSDSVGGSMDSMSLPPGVSPSGVPMQVGGWPGSATAYAGGPAAFINSTLGAAAAAASAASVGPPPGLQHGGSSSNYLSQQGVSPPPTSHTQQPQQQQLAGGGGGGMGDSWMGGPSPMQQMRGGGSHSDLQNMSAVAAETAARHRMMSGLPGGGSTPSLRQLAPSPPGSERGMPLHDALAATGGEMWDLAEEATRGPSRQLWLGNVHAGLPPGHLQALCQQFGPVQDAMVAPGTLTAVVLFARADDASRAAHALHGRDLPQLSYEGKPLVVRYCGSGLSGRHGDVGLLSGGPPPAPPVMPGSGPGGPEGVLGMGLPPSVEAALSAAGFGPRALEAAMQGLLPPDQQYALQAVLMQASASAASEQGAAAAAAAQQLRQLNQNRAQAQAQFNNAQQHRSSLGGMVPLQHHHGSMGHLVGLGGGSVGDFAALQAAPLVQFAADPQQPAGMYGGAEDADGAAASAPVSGGGAGPGGAAGSSTGGGGSTSGELEGACGSMGLDGEAAVDVPEGKPSRHLWLGNIPLKPNKLAMELLFARFGPLESVRVFPGKTFAFVNYLAAQHAVAAKMALDGQPAPSVTGSKPMVIRYQKDTSTVPANLGMAGGKSMSRSSSTQNLTGLTAAASLARLLDDDLPPEPAVNLSNKLNPNNIHYDRELAARYKRMSKAEKEALWAQDRAMQALGANAAAAAAAVNAGAGIAGLLDPNGAAARFLQAGLSNLAAGLGGGGGNDFLMPRVMSAGALDYLAASGGHGGGGGLGGGGGGHGGLFRVNTTQSLLGMQHAANAAMLLPQMGAGPGGFQGLLGQHAGAAGAGLDNAAAAQALSQQLHAAQQQALQQQLQQQAYQHLQQQLAGGGGQSLLNNLAMSQALANLGLGGGAPGAGAQQGGAMRGGAGAPGGGVPGGLDWGAMQAALANLGLGGAGPGGAASVQGNQQQQTNAALAALLQQHHQVHPQAAAQQRLQQHQQHQQHQQQQLAAAAVGLGGGGSGGVGNAALAAAVANAFGDGSGGPAGGGGAGGMHGPPKRMAQPAHGRMAVGPQPGMNPNMAAAGLMDPAAVVLVGGLQGLGGGPGGAPSLPPGAAVAGTAAGMAPPPGAVRPPAMGTFKQVPPSFLCPLTRQLMSDPVVAADGITYNRPAIAEWLRQHDASPVTRQPLANKMLTPNVALRNAIMTELGFGAGPT